jgi:PAT family beta-lactamase induction signal transducer AmpG
VMLLGFASGLPLALSGSTLAVWLTEANIDLATIGLFSLVGLPYTIKFLWAPLVDALDIPLLSRRFGRRRGWLIFSQLLLIAAIVLLGLCDPSASIPLITLGAVTVATASATQDIVIDAFRVESLETSEQAAGMAGYVAAYRVGMLVAGAGVLALVAWFEYRGIPHGLAWTWGYVVAALLMGVGLAATILAREPEGGERPPVKDAREVANRVFVTAYGAFEDFLTRPSAVAILLFVLLFKFCDAFAGVLTAPFVLKIGFDKETYAAIVKGVGFIAAILGGFAGGMIARAMPLSTSLWIAGLLQMASNLAGADRRERRRTHLHHRRGEFHRSHRHGNLRRLSLGIVRRPRAYRHAIRVAHSAGCGGPHRARLRRGLRRGGSRLVFVLCHHRGVGDTELPLALVVAAARAFRRA